MSADARHRQLVATLALRGRQANGLRDALRSEVAGWLHDGRIYRHYDAMHEGNGTLELACVPTGPAAGRTVLAALRRFARTHRAEVRGVRVAQRLASWLADQRRCACPRLRELLLVADAYGDPAPLRCVRCSGDVPIADRLPAPLVRGLLAWNIRHHHLHDLWLFDQGTYEQWAARELQFVDSLVNAEGRDLAVAVAREIRRPTWYRLWSDYLGGGRQARCPACKRGWTRRAGRRGADYWCDGCRIATLAAVDTARVGN